MNIDQRIEALQVNIESLHATVGELVEGMQRHDAQIVNLHATAGELVEGMQRHDAQIAKIVDLVEKLFVVADSHNRRLDDLEGRGQA